MAHMVKRLPAMRETWVQSLGREDPLEKETATHSSILAWKIPWTEEPGRLQSMRSQRVGHDGATSLSLSLSVPQDGVITVHMERQLPSLGLLSQRPHPRRLGGLPLRDGLRPFLTQVERQDGWGL